MANSCLLQTNLLRAERLPCSVIKHVPSREFVCSSFSLFPYSSTEQCKMDKMKDSLVWPSPLSRDIEGALYKLIDRTELPNQTALHKGATIYSQAFRWSSNHRSDYHGAHNCRM